MIHYAVPGLTALILVYVLFKRLTRPSLSLIRGPKSPSFIFGNLLELLQRPVGEADFAWQSQYGNIVRIKSVFGEDRLLISDPKALQKLLNTSSYNYQKLPNLRVISRMLSGKGIVWSDGEDHRRQRSILLPGFGSKETKVFLPIFKDCAEAIGMRWLETIGNNNGQIVLDVVSWLSRGALDSIGHAAFDVQFSTIQNDSHPLAKKYRNYVHDVLGLPPAKQIFMQAASKYIPTWIYQWIADNGPSARLARARDVKATVTSVAKDLIREKGDSLLQGQDNTDIFSLLVKATLDPDAKIKLSDEELLSQMRTLLVAGHETTSTAMSWILLELSRNPQIQSRLRDEIRKTEASVHARGDPQLTTQDLEGMPYLNAVIKEGLRFHPSVPQAFRVALEDEILPLSKPILTESGDMINEVIVPKGTEIVISIAAYNRDKDIWGEDAHEFKPERWLGSVMGERKLPGVGVYSHLMTFFSGTRACLGWRFAVMEIQAFLSTLVGKFEFAMTDKAERILRQPMFVMAPMVDGELSRGVQMPLATRRVCPLSNGENVMCDAYVLERDVVIFDFDETNTGFYEHISSMWYHEGWFPEESVKFPRADYAAYMVNRFDGLRILARYRYGIKTIPAFRDIVGHALAGWDGTAAQSNLTNLFYQIVDRYSPHVIANTFWSHTHEDELAVCRKDAHQAFTQYCLVDFYANNGTVMSADTALAVSWIGPSLTPLTNLNSGLRMYEVDSATFDVLDSYTWMSAVNEFPALDNQAEYGPTYVFEYSTREVYGGNITWGKNDPLNATWWHLVTEQMEYNSTLVQMFNTYQGESSMVGKPYTGEYIHAKICYMRSGSAPLALQNCPAGYGSVQ